ncbi:GAF and ANTAR domain-containing protein [Mycolicibacterium sediminis]|uniref:Transcription antitermination regulator n=1 Tax=Mycolicibacterium sediminis TaxID=1286180 RepID=A0A7I7QQ26_9MYCO|nr:GAF and ANTAR domain-containing protein [Mycolicibacterium sediminis]BBY28190.1 transcription antitermination regulator [Mycolicibacterium sediminis]
MAEFDGQPGREAPPACDVSAEQAQSDEVDLHQGLSSLAHVVADARSVEDLLSDVASFAVQAIPGVDGAGVTLVEFVSGSPRAHAWAATPGFVRDIEILQYNKLQEGPCITCMQTRRPAVSGSIGSDDRWPRLRGSVARMGVHSVLALPMLIGDKVIGAINSYAYERDVFAEHAVRVGEQFAAPAAVSIYNAQLLATARESTERMRRALESRTVIDQAIGIVRSRSGIAAEDAFERLTKISQAENVKLHVVAERLVDEAVRKAQLRQGSGPQNAADVDGRD